MSLRDALLKAGKVSKKQAQDARTKERKKRRKKKGHVLEAERESEQRARHQAQRAEQVADNRARAEAERVAREQHEHRMRISNLIRAWETTAAPRAARAFHFVRSNGRIGRATVDRRLAMELEFGSVAIVEHPVTGAPHFVRREGIERLRDIDWTPLRFYTGPDGPADECIRPPRRPESRERP